MREVKGIHRLSLGNLLVEHDHRRNHENEEDVSD